MPKKSQYHKYRQRIKTLSEQGLYTTEIAKVITEEGGPNFTARSLRRYLKSKRYLQWESSLKSQNVVYQQPDTLKTEKPSLEEKKVTENKPRKLVKPQFKKKKEKDEVGDFIQASIARIQEEAQNQ